MDTTTAYRQKSTPPPSVAPPSTPAPATMPVAAAPAAATAKAASVKPASRTRSSAKTPARPASAPRSGARIPAELTRPYTWGELRLVGVLVALTVLCTAWGLEYTDGAGIIPWYPAAGIVLAAATLGGLRWVPPILIAVLCAGLVKGYLDTPAMLVGTTILTGGAYSAAGLLLRQKLDPERPLARVHDAWWFIGAGVITAPLVAAVGFVLLRAATGSPASLEILRSFALGDALGVAAVAPGLIVWTAVYRRRGTRSALFDRRLLSKESVLAMLTLIALTPVAYVSGGELLALAPLPLCWLALRFALPGAVIGAALWSSSSAIVLSLTQSSTSFGALQSFLLAGTLIALILGAVVTERERTQKDLRHLALYDRASGLPNEANLLERLEAAIHESDGRSLSLLLVRFAGLRQVAANLRPEDTARLVATLTRKMREVAGPLADIARPGTDRFSVLLTGGDSLTRHRVAERLVEVLSAPIAVDSREVFVDPRVGITVSLPGEPADVVLAHADHAADVAAVADGERIGYFDASIERAQRERQELTEDLRLAVERGEFLLAFQPIVTAKEGRVVAAEALLRWVDQKRGAVSPADFVPIAEETGLILPIGRWVLHEACRRAATWPHVGGAPIGVSVNVSPIQLLDEGFLKDVASALEQSGLPAERLRVEITEGIVLGDIERTIQMIQQLREMGVETMLDDFGTGHSSLAWVQRLPVTCIKIDRAFVNDIAVDGIDRAIVHASLYLSRALGTDTVAEGVETEAQRDQLVRMGCQKLQGYLFARPQPADVFPDWLARQRKKAEPMVMPAPSDPEPRFAA